MDILIHFPVGQTESTSDNIQVCFLYTFLLITDAEEENSFTVEQQKIYEYITMMSRLFDVVRVVNVETHTEFTIDKNGKLQEKEGYCFGVWNKTETCSNCTSAKALASKGYFTKRENLGADTYFVSSRYVKFDDTEYIIETVLKEQDE